MKKENENETMKTVSVAKLISVYKDADDGGKKMLCGLYGEELFLPDYKKIKTYADACQVVGEPFDMDLQVGVPKHLIAYMKLCIIAKALNGDWKPDWINFGQFKYFPWFSFERKDASLSVDGANGGSDVSSSCLHSSDDYLYTFVGCGGALASQSEEIAIYFGKQFTEIWKDYLIV